LFIKIDKPSTSAVTKIENFQFVENVAEYFTSTDISNVFEDFHKIFQFKLQIDDDQKRPNQIELDNLAQKCSKNSIVLFLATKDGQKFFLYWKS